MPREKDGQPTRQIYASIREDIYLAAKSRATELRIPLRRFIEQALELALAGGQDVPSPQVVETSPPAPTSVWDDEYLRMQARQPIGNPVELTPDEARRIAREAFGTGSTPTETLKTRAVSPVFIGDLSER